MDRLIQQLVVKVGFQCVRYPTGQDIPGIQVYVCDHIDEAAAEEQVGEFDTPDLIAPFHVPPVQ